MLSLVYVSARKDGTEMKILLEHLHLVVAGSAVEEHGPNAPCKRCLPAADTSCWVPVAKKGFIDPHGEFCAIRCGPDCATAAVPACIAAQCSALQSYRFFEVCTVQCRG